MRKVSMVAITLLAIITLASCSRVEPNYYGVLMENYGKNGKSDYSKQQGSVWTAMPGTMLFQVPAFEQRAEFTEIKQTPNDDLEQTENTRTLDLKSSDNTQFTASPLYSYKVIADRVVDVVFQNARLGNTDDSFMKSLEDNILEPHIYDIIKEESRKYSTDTLMADGGSLQFETKLQSIIKKSFEGKGLELITFSANLDFSDKVKAKIDSRNEVNTNMSVLDQQIIEQKKKNELALLRAEENKIISTGLTPQLIQQMFIEKWDGKTPLYGNMPTNLLVQPK